MRRMFCSSCRMSSSGWMDGGVRYDASDSDMERRSTDVRDVRPVRTTSGDRCVRRRCSAVKGDQMAEKMLYMGGDDGRLPSATCFFMTTSAK